MPDVMSNGLFVTELMLTYRGHAPHLFGEEFSNDVCAGVLAA